MRKNINVTKIVLHTIAILGLVSVAVLAPNAMQMLDMFSGKKKRTYHQKTYINNVIARLKKQGLIKLDKKGKNTFVTLTNTGKILLDKYRLKEMVIIKPKRWDYKWRIIIFDIKESRRILRDAVRKELINLGFVQLQKSVWIYPYDCEDIVALLKADARIGKDILYMVVEKLENDYWLKKYFNL